MAHEDLGFEESYDDLGFTPDDQAEAPSLGSRALSALGKVGRAIDSYTGAPVRSAISAGLDGKSAMDAYLDQFGSDQDQHPAPTGKAIAQKLGVSDRPLVDFSDQTLDSLDQDPDAQRSGAAGFARLLKSTTRSGAAGLGIDVAADPTNLIPAAGLAKDALSGTRLAEAASSGALRTLGKVGHAFTGVPEADVAMYASKTPEVDSLIARSGGQMDQAADAVREGYQNALQNTRQQANTKISQVISQAPTDKVYDVQPVLDMVNRIKGRVNASLNPEVVNQIDELMSRVASTAENGKVDLKTLNDVKDFLQGRGKRAYVKDGQIFQSAGEAQQAAKAGAAGARRMVNQAAPDLADANQTLSALHGLDNRINPNLITPGAPDSALFAAGSGLNPRNQSMLGRLGDLTGTDAVGEAQKLSAARSFANPPLLPVDTTGKATTRVGLGAAAGGILGHMAGVGVYPGAAIGGALTSPAMLKAGIQGGRAIGGLAPLAKGLAKGAIGSRVESTLLDRFRANPELINLLQNPALKAQIQKQIQREPSEDGGDISSEPVQSLKQSQDQFIQGVSR